MAWAEASRLDNRQVIYLAQRRPVKGGWPSEGSTSLTLADGIGFAALAVTLLLWAFAPTPLLRFIAIVAAFAILGFFACGLIPGLKTWAFGAKALFIVGSAAIGSAIGWGIFFPAELVITDEQRQANREAQKPIEEARQRQNDEATSYKDEYSGTATSWKIEADQTRDGSFRRDAILLATRVMLLAFRAQAARPPMPLSPMPDENVPWGWKMLQWSINVKNEYRDKLAPDVIDFVTALRTCKECKANLTQKETAVLSGTSVMDAADGLPQHLSALSIQHRDMLGQQVAQIAFTVRRLANSIPEAVRAKRRR